MKLRHNVRNFERCEFMNIKKLSILGLVSVSLLMGGCSMKGDEAAKGDMNYLPVQIQQVVKENIEKEYFTIGTVKAEDSVIVNPKVPGTVTKIHVEVGDKVKKGQLLFEIDGGDTVNKLNLGVASSKEQLNQAKVSLDDAKKNYDDMSALYEEGSISESEYIQVKSGYEKAQSGYNTALSSYNSNVKTKSNTVSDLRVVSTIDGIVGDIDLVEGQMASSGNSVKIFSDDEYIIEVSVTEESIEKFSVGQDAKVVIPSKNDKEYQGVITSVSPIAASGTHTFPIEIAIQEGNDLREGMYGEVTMITDSIDNQVIIPLNSVIRKGEEQFVYKYEEEKAVKIPVEKGIIEGEKVQVFGDISEEDMIIVKGQNYISEDSLLKVVD